MRRTGMAVLSLMTIASAVSGQRSALREVRYGDRGSWGLNVTISKQLGSVSQLGNDAYGVGGYMIVGGPLLGWRIDGGYQVYGHEYQGYGVSTTSQIGSLALGPQITLGPDPLRVYGFFTAGPSLFWTNASDGYGCGCEDHYFLDGDLTWTRSAGAGVLITVARRRTPIAIDIGLRGVRHDRVEYVPAGGVTQNPDGSFTGQRVRTPVDMRVVHFGVSIGIR